MSAMPRATAATVSSFGRSADTSLDMKPNTCAGSLRGAGTTFTARSPTRTRSPVLHAVHRRADRARAVAAPVEHDAAVHLDVVDRQPAPPGRGRTSGGWSSSRTRAGRRRRRPPAPTRLMRRRGRAVLADLLEDVLQRLRIRRAHDDLGVARLLARRADAEVRDLVIAPVQQDEVEHFRERLRVDDVPVEVNGFGGHAGILAVRERFQGAGCRVPRWVPGSVGGHEGLRSRLGSGSVFR